MSTLIGLPRLASSTTTVWGIIPQVDGSFGVKAISAKKRHHRRLTLKLASMSGVEAASVTARDHWITFRLEAGTPTAVVMAAIRGELPCYTVENVRIILDSTANPRGITAICCFEHPRDEMDMRALIAVLQLTEGVVVTQPHNSQTAMLLFAGEVDEPTAYDILREAVENLHMLVTDHPIPGSANPLDRPRCPIMEEILAAQE